MIFSNGDLQLIGQLQLPAPHFQAQYRHVLEYAIPRDGPSLFPIFAWIKEFS